MDITCRKRERILHISKRVESGKHGGREKGIACYCSYKQCKQEIDKKEENSQIQ